MAQFTLAEALAGSNPEAQMSECLYLVRDGATLLYIGKTTQLSVRGRLLAHLGQGPAFMRKSRLGELIEAHHPASAAWSVEILTRDGWNAIFQAAGLPRRYKLNTAESALIKHLRPQLNRTSHPDHARPLPWVKDEA